MSKRTETSRPSAIDSGDDDAFLSRWARRKRAVRSGGDPDADDARAVEGAPAGDAETSPAVAADAPRQDDAEERPELTDADMPPMESIDENTDMSGFFSRGVSQTLRKAALRKFFHSQAFNFVDGLDDYDDDFRNFEALGDIITSDMRGRMEVEAKRAEEALAENGEETSPAHAEPGSEPAAEPDMAAQSVSGETGTPPGTAQATDPSTESAAGITRDPSRLARSAPGKLRPARDPDGDADEDAVGEGEDA